MLENQCNPVERPCQGRGRAMPPVCILKRLVSVPVWILKRLVLVFINACRLLSALPLLPQFGRGRLSLLAISFYSLLLLLGPCRFSEFTLAGPQWSHATFGSWKLHFYCPLGRLLGLFENDCLRYVCLAEFTWGRRWWEGIWSSQHQTQESSKQ